MAQKLYNYNSKYIIDACQYANWNRQIFTQMRKGNVTCVNATITYWENTREALTRIAQWRRLFSENSDLIIPARSYSDIQTAKRDNKTAISLAFQHCLPIEEEIDLIEVMYDLGVRFMQLSYNNQSTLATGWMEREDNGITRFGREVIQEMNKVGLVIDMSHSAEKSTLDAIEISERPIAITHANPSSWCSTQRNKSDLVLKKLYESNGMLGFSLYPNHLRNGSKTTLKSFCEMVSATADLIGTKNIGIGSDLIQGQPTWILEWMRSGKWTKHKSKHTAWPQPTNWFQNNNHFSRIGAALIKQGFSEEEVDDIMGLNWFRFIREAFSPS